ncbi:MAG: response regulator [Cyclobacteriaceae bacterium]
MKPLKLFLLLITSFQIFSQVSNQSLLISREGFPISYQLLSSNQVWDVTQDEQGVVYLGIVGDLQSFDGQSFNSIARVGIRSFAKNKRGRIYAGGIGELGYITSDSLGRTIFSSLKDKIDTIDVTKIEEVLNHDDRVYFAGSKHVYEYDESSQQMIVHQTGTNSYPMFIYDNAVIVPHATYGWCQISNGKLQKADPLLTEIDRTVSHVLSVADSLMFFIGTNEFLLLADGQLTQKTLDWDESLSKAKLYNVQQLSDQFYAFCFLEEGLVITDRDFKQIAHWKGTNGFVNNVFDAYLGLENDLWVATNDGVFVLDMNSGISILDEKVGLKGLVSDIEESEDGLLVSTFDGLYVKEWNENGQSELFERVPNSGIYSYDLLPTGEGYFVNAYEGVGYFKDDIYQVLEEKLSSNGFVAFAPDSVKVIATGSEGKEILVFEYRKASWALSNRIDTEAYSGIFNIFKRIQWDPYLRHYWGSTSNNVFSFQLNTDCTELIAFTKYTTADGLPNEKRNVVVRLGEEIRFLSDSGLFRYDQMLKKFEKDNTFGDLFDQTGLYLLTKQDENTYYYASKNNVRGIIYRQSVDKSFKAEARSMSQIGSNLQVAYNSSKGILFGGYKGIYQVDDPRKVDFGLTTRPLITEVATFDNSTDSIIFYGNKEYYDASNSYQNGYSYRFRYSFPFYIAPEAIFYSYKLEGYDKNWSSWTQKQEKEYTNMPAGEYTFLVKAKNVYDGQSGTTAFPLLISAPWYGTYWAYCVYLICVAAFIWLIVRINARRLKRENEKLEQIILERTEEIRYQAEKLQTLDNAKSRFFANISHELRTPLTLIQAPLESVLNGSLGKVNDSIKSNLELSRSSSRKLLNLVGEILELSKLEAGKLELKLEAVKCYDLIKRIFFTYQSIAETRNVRLKMDYRLKEDSIVKVDIGKLEKVLDNLLSNAVKFTPDKGEIKMTVENHNDRLHISVEDNGEGIDKEELDQIFDRFYQAGKKNQYVGGTGIGLSLAKELSHLMEGTLDVDSSVGIGTRFTLSIPLLIADKEEMTLDPTAEIIQSSSANKTNDPLDLKSAQILLVEDQDEMRAFIKKELNSYDVDEARDGLEALEMVQQKSYDLIITDLMMPRIDGMELVQNLKMEEKTKQLSIIMITARAADEDKIEGLTLGIDDYIVKPFNPNELRVRVNNLLINRKARKAVDEEPISSADDQLIKKLKEKVISQLREISLTVATLAAEASLSERQLNRTVKKITGLTAGSFIREIRLNEARIMLENRTYNTISEVSYAAGFEKPGYFSEVYSKRFGKRPAEYFG